MSKISILFRKIKIQREISNVTEIFQNHNIPDADFFKF